MLRRWYPGSVGAFGDGERILAPITVATFASAQRHMALELGARFDLLVVDEAHHLGTAGRQELLLMCAAPWRLGLTATPPVGAGADRLSTALGPVRFELRVAQLRGTYLANLQVVQIGVELSCEERAEYDEARQEFTELYGRFCSGVGQVRFGEFVAAVGHSRDGRRAVQAWHRARKVLSFPAEKERTLAALLEQHRQDHRVLVFTADRQAAFAIARRFLIMPITSDIGRRERERALRAFEAGRIRALVSPRVLNEGLDVPAADVGIVVGSGLGAREFVQRVGRLLRKVDGKETAVVYQLVARNTVEAVRGNGLEI
jgi:superfamily II DNA or RNA helicase